MNTCIRQFTRPAARSAVAGSLLAALLLCGSGCGAPAIRNEAVAAAKLGGDVSTAAITVYGKLDGLAEKEIQLQNEINVILSPQGMADKVRFTSTNASLSEQLDARIAAYRQLGKAYAQFSLLASTDFSGQAQEAATALNSAIAGVNGLQGLEQGPLDAATGLGGLIIGGVQAGKIKEHNLVLQKVATGFAAAWAKDEPVLIRYVNRIYESYAVGLEGLTLANFDAKRLGESVHEPFRDDILAGLYKLERRKAVLAESAALIADVQAIGPMLTKLARVHGELAKKEPSVTETLQTIDQVLAQIEKLEK